MKIAAWQMPIEATTPHAALAASRVQVRRCEEAGVSVLCCRGAGDWRSRGRRRGTRGHGDPTPDVDATLAPIASEVGTVIVGFTERGEQERLYNAAAIVRRGAVIGIYRKAYPAIHRSV